uniref:Shugoshin C-terminal domain-containing protein n=1 Tax=Peronospora matthiolae TaxID=2874970 RepID=A0AAV1UA57_9STRA
MKTRSSSPKPFMRPRHAAQENADREVAGIRKQLDKAGERLVAECGKLSHSLDKANSKKSKYKKTGLHFQENLSRALKLVAGLQADQETLCRALKQVSGLQAELGEAQDSLSARSANCDQLRRIKSDRDVSLDHMRVRVADVALERDRELRDNTTLRDRMASLVSGDTSATPSKVGSSTNTPVPATPQPMSNGSGLSRKRSRDPLPSSTLPPFKKVTRSGVSKAKPSPVCDPKVARSATAKAKLYPVCDPKPPSPIKGGIRDPEGRRDLNNRHDPAKSAASPKLVKQRRRSPGLTSSEGRDKLAGEDETLVALSG